MKRGLLLIILIAFFFIFPQTGFAESTTPWSEPIRVSENEYRTYVGPNNAGHSAATDRFGNIHIVWCDGTQYLYRKFDAMGRATTPVKRVATSGDACEEFNLDGLAIDRSDNIHVIWEEHDGTRSDWDLFYVKLNNNGDVIITKRALISGPAAWSNSPSFKTIGDYVYLAWIESALPFVFSELRLTKLNLDGTRAGPDVLLSQWAKLPNLAIDSSGNINVVWFNTQNFFIEPMYYSKLRSSDLTPIINREVIRVPPSTSSQARIASDTRDNIHIVWTERVRGCIFCIRGWYKVIDAQGGTVVEDVLIGDQLGHGNIVVDVDDTAHIAFHTYNGGFPQFPPLSVVYARIKNGRYVLAPAVIIEATGVPMDAGQAPILLAPGIGNLAPIGDLYVAYFRGTNWIGAYTVGKMHLRQSETYTTLSYQGPVTPGSSVPITVSDPTLPNKNYVLALALNTQPPTPLGNGLSIRLASDPLFMLSIALPHLFGNIQGTLGSTGQAQATLRIPDDPVLSGLRFYIATVVFDNEVRSISDSLGITIS